MRAYLTCMGADADAELRACDLDLSTGALRTLSQTRDGVTNPLYADIDSGGRFMYVADQVPDCDGTPGGAICAFAINPDGSLRYLNRRPSGGTTPCYVAVSNDGRLRRRQRQRFARTKRWRARRTRGHGETCWL